MRQGFLAGLCLIAGGWLILARVIGGVWAESENEKLQALQQQIQNYEAEITRLKKTAATLGNQIAQFDAQIKLTTLRILEINEKIDLLANRLNTLKGSLEVLYESHASRALATYRFHKLDYPLYYAFSQSDLSSLLRRMIYLKRIGEEDVRILNRLKEAQGLYETEIQQQKKLQEQLKQQETDLAAQKAAKANLLSVTKNDEKRYQQLLASARSEYEAIQAIVSGQGTESLVGEVAEGGAIANVIQGASCNSSGSHLHFIIGTSGQVKNPFEYLSGGVAFENCSGSSCGSSDGDIFNPTGSWRWPISPTIKFMQGYGLTWAIKNSWVGRIYSFHNGIDINSSDTTVRAVKSGRLYRGSYGGLNSCRLRYVRVDHADSDLETYYLHVNY